MQSTAKLGARSERKTNQIQSVARAVGLLELLAAHGGGLRAKELSELAQLNVSTCQHLLRTLVNAKMVRLDREKHVYLLGSKIAELYRRYIENTSIVQRVHSVLEDLSMTTLEPAYISAWREGQNVLLHKVQTARPGMSQVRIGFPGFAHCRASGKVLLAALPEDELAAYLRQSPLTARTEHTIVDENRLRNELALVRTQGFAVDREEFALGWCCISAPIVNRNGKVVAAIAISFRKDRIDEWDLLCSSVQESARLASADFGDHL